MGLRLVPIERPAANAFVGTNHRHSKPAHADKFRVAIVDDDGKLRGVGQAGRVKARALEDGRTIEIVRVCTDGVQNGCSMLYGALSRAARALGYSKVITYTVDGDDEDGASLKASGFHIEGYTTARQWDTPSRPRAQRDALPRVRWAKDL